MNPVARVAVDVPLAHLDRPFDYLVPERLAAQAVPGCRVRVRFNGLLVNGFVLARAAASEFAGGLLPLTRVVSAEPVLSAEVAGLARAVADRYAGTLADVLRLAVPPRRAAVEREPLVPPGVPPSDRLSAGTWQRYVGGPAFLAGVTQGRSVRAVWTAVPGDTWCVEIAATVAACLAGGRGALVVVPDARDVARVDAALGAALGPGRHVALTADLGPAKRYRRWLAVRRGVVSAVVGTRASMFAPVGNLGLVVVWDDGDDLHAEPQAPYPHVRDVLVLRAHRIGAGALVGGFARTAEGEALLASGWAKALAAPRDVVRSAAPRVAVATDDAVLQSDPAARAARLPSPAIQTARQALAADAPVLVQVPRRGYVPVLACADCRASARCVTCAGPLGLAAGGPDAVPGCRWCGQQATGWRCVHCDSDRLRAVVVGVRRTAEEIGRAFPDVPVVTSGRDGVLAAVPGQSALVVCTPGAEPVAAGGDGAGLLLDGWALLARPDLRAAEEALRCWFAAAALARSGTAGGRVVIMATAGVPAVEALVRWDPGWAAGRELRDRAELRFPPAVRMASLTGTPAGVAELLAGAELPASAELLGPVAVVTSPPGPGPPPGAEPVAERMLVRVSRADGPALAAALKAASAAHAARGSAFSAAARAGVRLDPIEVG